ncbi:uncharacterized protein LOC129280871 isoform X2 [Lytechinus pictus]|uniref:uncharacterized protein LOC129280871 isoform X2 n=1 Tax=Lytechinus pictus TaxID=7653 RepID=UPI0030BA16B4
MANHTIPRYVSVIVLMTAFLQMASVRVKSEHGTGYVGCYPVGPHWQGVLTDKDSIEETVDDCAYHCSGYTYTSIAIRSCFCSNGLPYNSLFMDEQRCNITCSRNPCQICGAGGYYSVYNTAEILNRVQVTAGLSCCKFEDSSKHFYAECVDRTNRTMESDEAPSTMSTYIPTTEIGTGYVGCYPIGLHWQDVLTDKDSIEETVDDCAYHCSGYTYTAIAIRSCFCSNGLPYNILVVDEQRCNITCSRNPCQICGAGGYFSVYNTAEILNRVKVTAGLSCCIFEDSSKHVYAECVDRTNRTMESDESTSFPTTEIVWLRIVIDVVVILAVLFLIILGIILSIVRCFERRGNARSDHRLRSIIRVDNTNATTSPRPGAFYQSLIFNSEVQNVQSATDVIPSPNTHTESHQPTMPDSAGEPVTSVSLQGNIESESQAPSTTPDYPKESDDADHRPEPIAVDGEGYVPMDRISRVSVNVQTNAKLSNDGMERVTNQQPVNYENRDVWRKRDRRTQIKDRI